MRKLKKLLKLPLADTLRLVRVAGLLVMVDLGLKLLPFRALQACLARKRLRWHAPPAVHERSLDRLVWAVDVVGGYSAGSCLRKALALQWLLSRRGLSTRLWLGVHGGKATLQAHAWLECDGRVILGGPVGERYTPLHCFDSGDALAKDIARDGETP
jgi:Transglutaminase-like superfamily